MRILGQNNLTVNFRAHPYKVQPRSNEVTIQNDNIPYFGNAQYLVTNATPATQQ